MASTHNKGDRHLFVGWDVGGWHCDRNSESRDAVVVLERSGDCAGTWRGNLRSTINRSADAEGFLAALLELCKVQHDAETLRATFAIDAPLAFPAALSRLITDGEALECVGDKSAENPYLFRFTEQRLPSEDNIRPLSAIKDMIGSQATKAMHVMLRFGLRRVETGIWSNGSCLTAIETYPTLCRARLNQNREAGLSHHEADIADARVCAGIAHDFQCRRGELEGPPSDAPAKEGWIWAPKPRIAVSR